MKVLVVEDEKKIADFICKGLEQQGFTVELSRHGDEAYAQARSQSFDAIVLDIMLPGRDGLSILRSLREQKNTVPVILLTARTEPSERVEGLNLGADDYLAKPFYFQELVARIHAVARRTTGDQLSVLQAGDVMVNLVTRQVTVSGEAVELTPREFTLMEYLLRWPGRVLTRVQILEQVWGYDFDPQTNLVDTNIKRLRRKLDPDGTRDLIETVRGVGYRFRKVK
ncbi:MAG: response regulator transcription factor [Verrucomicrobiia bacterium]|jgi:DNA-binding response OmpR family regulator